MTRELGTDCVYIANKFELFLLVILYTLFETKTLILLKKVLTV